MAPAIGISISDHLTGKPGLGLRRTGAAADAEELKWRNLELEREVRERREREEEMGRELERTKGMLKSVEEAEERLCAQLGELEAEAIAQARVYNRRIKALSDRLAEAQRIIAAGVAGLKVQ
ncbi:hypothetical protein KSP39_PZI014815 [Platanthera zijinensis]|uniref:Uncharacterized protein n=1 Tax=Platanthera zijinensis TaxID=2320716 RepID=A0AAP0BA49_9ASPA